ncbi:MAG: penicillin acylase family protein [Xanthomonadales bacterium]|nr:penicillin acylase family protein [Xanthomonadales bacterium]
MRKWLVRLSGSLLTLGVVLVLGAWLILRGSLPQLDGERPLVGLKGTVEVQRDSLGSVSLHGDSQIDLTRALGYVHAQERFFEMDLSRRRAAGELAELFGPAALDLDRRTRVHRFRARAQTALSDLPPAQRELLEAYSDGINQGVQDLSARPMAYWLVRQQPRHWQPEDSVLVGFAMYLMLQENGVLAERERAQIYAHLPPSVAAFLLRAGTPWDAPLAGGPIPPPAIPPQSDFDARKLPAEAYDELPAPAQGLGISAVDDRHDQPLVGDQHSEIGSNNFAVGGAISAHGGAILANDMHLGHGVPNIWFRLCLHDRSSEIERVCGVSLPGLPGVVSGSNGHVAWGYTNSYGDWFDWVELAIDPDDPDRYLSAEGPQSFVSHEETIRVAGAEEETLTVRETVWGPVFEGDQQPPMALRWVAHLPGAMNLGVAQLAEALNVEQALTAARQTGMPAQNLLVVDRGGRLAWTVIGPIPQRSFEQEPDRPLSGAVPAQIWAGWLPPELRPQIIDPDSSRLWTANNRTMGGEAGRILGDGGYDLGARAGQIRDRLAVGQNFSEADLRAIQLDDQALFLEPWWHLLNQTLQTLPDRDRAAAIDAVASRWNREAAADSAAYRLVRAFRLQTHEFVLAPFAAAIGTEVEDFQWPRLPQSEGVVWQILNERPAHLLGSPWPNYDALLASALETAVAELSAEGELAEQTWGKRNTTAIRHPLSRALPALGWLLNMPAQELPGDSNMPRVQAPAFGASERLVVAPGHEESGLFHMPGGQSGHPLSPFYGSGHDDWAEGRATPFLPGPTVYQLTLVTELGDVGRGAAASSD